MLIKIHLYFSGRANPQSVITEWNSEEIPRPIDVVGYLRNEGAIEDIDGVMVSWDDDNVEFMSVTKIDQDASDSWNTQSDKSRR